ncbi:ATP-binding protein [Halostella pelagica]|uniref:ATP-binding protein n=1 Tax=Halostella pelagica TaxID=2583824 RepID=UPI001081C32D|nr:ATP-binding protein [Halostella pelagica]
MARSLTVLFVVSDAVRRGEIADAIDERPDLSADVSSPSAVPPSPSVDCLIADAAFVGDCRHADLSVPVIVWSADPPSEVSVDGTAGYVRYDPDDPDIDRVVDQATWATRSESNMERIEALHASAADLVACRTEQELFDRTVEAAERILDFDICGIDKVEDGYLVPRSVSDGMADEGFNRLSVEEGIAGRTHRTGESVLIDDVRNDGDAELASDRYRSILSVPVGDAALFQAAATEIGAFDERDRELAELLLSHVAETRKRILAEEALLGREAELVTERDRFAALFENVPDSVVSYEIEDGAPIVADINGQFEETFGYDAAEIVGENLDDYVVPDGRVEAVEEINQSVVAGERFQTTVRRKTADGVRDFLLHVAPLEVGERSQQGYTVYTDITDQKRRERELERQNERLDEFASIVSHDLRNPLNVASGFLDLARESGDEEHFDQVGAAHDRMGRMIDELLSLARQGDIVGEMGPVELRVAATEAWASVDTDECTLLVETERVVDADEDRLGDLLRNLFRNAIEHGTTSDQSDTDETRDRGSDAARVRVGDFEGGFFVADNGPGIPEDERSLVFESGYTTHENGTGYGLSIVEQISEAHGWTVDVVESESGGARFEFSVGE